MKTHLFHTIDTNLRRRKSKCKSPSFEKDAIKRILAYRISFTGSIQNNINRIVLQCIYTYIIHISNWKYKN